MQIILKGLPKISLNEWYAGNHWTKRKAIKDQYHWIIKSQFKGVLSRDNVYEVDYAFYFKNNALDASNTIAMVKMIEDIIFEYDGWKVITKITISSRKGTEDLVNIEIKIK
jgi:hypothetical protein